MHAAYGWYYERNPNAAAALLSEIDKAILAIAENPAMWAPYLEDTRRFILSRFPFSVVYRANSDGVLVVAFAHSRRRPGYWRNR